MHVEPTALSRLRAFELPARTFRIVADLSTLALWLIVSTGAVVRLTGSGLGCDHWPGCEPGRPFPEKDYHAYIEFGNRMVGGVTIAITLALAASAFLVRGLPRWARWTAVGVAAGTIAQAPLGAIAVYTHLNPLAVAPHLVLSIVVLGASVVVALEARLLRTGHGTALAREARLVALAIAAANLVLVVAGTLTTAAGPHSGGTHVARVGSLDTALVVHGATAAIFGCGLVFLLGWLYAHRSELGWYLRATIALIVLVLVQMALGDVQYRTHLPW